MGVVRRSGEKEKERRGREEDLHWQRFKFKTARQASNCLGRISLHGRGFGSLAGLECKHVLLRKDDLSHL